MFPVRLRLSRIQFATRQPTSPSLSSSEIAHSKRSKKSLMNALGVRVYHKKMFGGPPFLLGDKQGINFQFQSGVVISLYLERPRYRFYLLYEIDHAALLPLALLRSDVADRESGSSTSTCPDWAQERRIIADEIQTIADEHDAGRVQHLSGSHTRVSTPHGPHKMVNTSNASPLLTHTRLHTPWTPHDVEGPTPFGFSRPRLCTSTRRSRRITLDHADSRRIPEPDLMSGTLHSQHETLEREHYPECSQLVYDDANEFNDFVAEYLKSQFSIDEPSRDLQYVWRDAYLDLYDGSIAPEMLSEDFWTLVEAWDSIRVNSRDATRPKAVPAPRVKQEASTISKSSAEDQDTPTLPETPKEHITECSTSIHGLAGLQAQTPSLLGKTREERRTCNSVVSIHVKGEDIPSPDASAAYKPSDPIPVSSPIPISPATPKPCPSTLSNKHDSPRVIREVRRKRDSTLESRNASERVQMTRSQTRLSSLKTSSLSTPREPHRNRRSSLAKDNELSKAHNNGFHGKPPSELTAETAPAVSCTSSKSPTHVEKRQLSEPPVLVQKHSDKSTGTIKSLPKSRVVAAAMLRVPSSKVASRYIKTCTFDQDSPHAV
ncbi:hypothetical protein F5887DRAFT_918267 [Amanita rubescens]|nr:hypothetical protein F5887DRAFT_918267 [Amanita rubescens]